MGAIGGRYSGYGQSWYLKEDGGSVGEKAGASWRKGTAGENVAGAEEVAETLASGAASGAERGCSRDEEFVGKSTESLGEFSSTDVAGVWASSTRD